VIPLGQGEQKTGRTTRVTCSLPLPLPSHHHQDLVFRTKNRNSPAPPPSQISDQDLRDPIKEEHKLTIGLLAAVNNIIPTANAVKTTVTTNFHTPPRKAKRNFSFTGIFILALLVERMFSQGKNVAPTAPLATTSVVPGNDALERR
jgi:hypothetical protein